MRQYQPIWNQLKKHKIAKIMAHVSKHRTIIQAVRKEKCMDMAFKLLASEAEKKYKLFEEVNEDKTVITFYLQDVTGITVKDL